MKESKFIELLNLYVDHQISPDDAKLLESEVESNPTRRRIYRQYCQMQKACALMGAGLQHRLMGDVAVVCYVRLVQRLDEAGKSITARGEETRVWRRAGDTWRHVHFHRSVTG